MESKSEADMHVTGKLVALIVGMIFFAGVIGFSLARGSVKMRGGRLVSRANEPGEYWALMSAFGFAVAVCAISLANSFSV
jgi:hypothetical protein